MNDQVAVGYLTGGHPEAAFISSLDRLRGNRENRIVQTIQVLSGPKVDDGRNQLFSAWLDNTPADYLLMVDDDMVIPPDAITRLRGHRKDIVGGLCFAVGMSGVMKPTIHMIVPDDEGKPTLKVMFDYPTDELIQVDATGAACMLVTRRCAKAVKEAMGESTMPWFAFGVHNNVRIGEDTGFCLRAAKLGITTWVDTGLEVQHLKVSNFGEVEYVRSLMLESHPYYDRRHEVPIYRELMNDHSSVDHSDPSGEWFSVQGVA